MSISKIEWTQETWNPVVGCSIVSPGCTNCYAMKMAARIEAMGNQPRYAGTTKKVNGNAIWTGKLAQAPDSALLLPLKRKKPTTYFVNSMGDIFHEDCPDDWIDKVFAVMALCSDIGRRHTFQILTKRADRMLSYVNRKIAQAPEWVDLPSAHARVLLPYEGGLPKSIWLGVSTERQQEADERIPLLLQTPAAVRFISAEPLLAPIRLHENIGDDWLASGLSGEKRGLNWVIVGGESGPSARPMNPQWARDIRDQCSTAGIAFFHKQNGEYASVSEVEGEGAHFHFSDGRTVRRVGKKRAGRLLDGREHNAMPEGR